MEGIRKIIHIDMDAFFASIEQRDFPHLKGKPVAVGGSGNRGVVAAASYEARRYGIRSAMPSKVALRKCPHLIFVRHRFDVYKEVSRQIQAIFHEYTDLVEPLSLDEAFLDVTFHKKGKPSATLIAEEIRKRIKEETNLTASAGVSFNKFLAKIASDQNKPDGLFAITPDMASEFMMNLEIEKFFGIGKVTAEKLRNIGVHFGRDLHQLERQELIRMFGKAGSHYYDIVRCEDHRPVNPTRIRKSFGAERTFHEDLYTFETLEEKLTTILEELNQKMERQQIMGKTITIKIKTSKFEQHTKSQTFLQFLQDQEFISTTATKLLREFTPLFPEGIRLLGCTFSNLNTTQADEPIQLTLDF
ncbi:DNA polymerase IV [Puteibacter caeruleilacunae]|nr:DNA polymerase IV [Puteibacter caeruleilacunae]